MITTPDWAYDLILYEIATPYFNAPANGIGGFRSVAEKMPYLGELGINGVWLTGNNLANYHFYNIWCQYATLRQDVLDPCLGSTEDFCLLIDEAHAQGIRVFLDVITHGVVNDSPMLQEHPEWFREGSWGMTDFDWFGGHEDLDRWWVECWVTYVLEYGVDGFRIDCDLYRPDLWLEIKRRCLEAGTEVLIIIEGKMRFPGVTDGPQYAINISSHDGLLYQHPFIKNPAGYIQNLYKPVAYSIQVCYADGTKLFLEESDERVLIKGAKQDEERHVTKSLSYHVPQTMFSITDLPNTKEIVSAQVTNREDGHLYYGDNFHCYLTNNCPHLAQIECWLDEEVLYITAPFIEQTKELLTHQISCHDAGWQGFPLGENPYSVQGSRCLMAYAGLFTPTVPLFFAGEEYNSAYQPTPRLKPSLYGDQGKEGDGRWLYGNMIDWSQLEKPAHQQMFQDTKKMIAIRTQESDLLCSHRSTARAHISPLAYTSESKNLPVPFCVWNTQKALIIAGNYHNYEISCSINLPLETMGFQAEEFKITNLWTNEQRQIKHSALEGLLLTIAADKQSGGGCVIYKIEPMSLCNGTD